MPTTPKQTKSELTNDPNFVIDAELNHLELSGRKDVKGLAISGGGIRSASFGLGVMQALVLKGQLEKIDYMSTVSGGGYLGAALTYALKKDQTAGTTAATFPLGRKEIGITRKEAGKDTKPDGDDNNLLNFIRQHASYLSPVKSLDMISFSAVVLRSMIMSLSVYLGIFIIAMTCSLWLLYHIAHGVFDGPVTYTKTVFDYSISIPEKGILIVAGIIILMLMVIMGLFYSLGTYLKSERVSRARYSGFIGGQKALGAMLKISFACFILGSLPFVTDWIQDSIKTVFAAGGSTVIGSFVGIWQYMKARRKEKNKGGLSDIVIYLGAFALFYGIILLAYVHATRFFLDKDYDFNNSGYFVLLIALSFVFGYFVNLNYLGPHYIWRNRLMEAFMPEKDAITQNQWKAAKGADAALMKDMCQGKNRKPYHIINTNIILPNSKKVEYSGRGGDNFIISPLYCGSSATGWETTNTFQNESTRGVTLASAMATSAAALNPNAAVSGQGITRNIVVSILLSMLNLRLGYWASNPKRKDLKSSPNFLNPGLKTEIFRWGFTEDDRKVLLSDGGHYENLAFYELIRRKLSLIIVSDGGADPLFNFDDLANAVEKVRVDFNAIIDFDKHCKTDGILPGSLGDDLFQKKYEIAKRGYAIAKIYYNDGTVGTLVYIKLAMIDGLPTDIYSYKGLNPTFPHQSTSDQFFDENQFEAYRELGYYVTKHLLDSNDWKKIVSEHKMN